MNPASYTDPTIYETMIGTFREYIEKEYPLHCTCNCVDFPNILHVWYSRDNSNLTPWAEFVFTSQNIILNIGPRYTDWWPKTVVLEYANPALLDQINEVLSTIEL